MHDLKSSMPRILHSLAEDFEKIERYEYDLHDRTEAELIERVDVLKRILGKVVEPLVEIAFERGRRSVMNELLK